MGRIVIGRHGRQDVSLDIDVLLRTRLLIQGNSGAGKSWLVRRIAEQIFGKVQVLVIDPEGEFATLREHHGYVLVGKGGETAADPRSGALVAKRLLELNASAVCDIYELRAPDRHRWVRNFLEALIDAPKSLWHPAVVIVDESHVYCPEKGQGESEAAGAMVDLATRGRKRGFAAILATQRLGKLSKNAAAELLNVMVGQTFIDIDQHRAAEVLGVARADQGVFFRDMKVTEPGNFWALGRAVARDRTLVKIGPVQTSHPEPGSSRHAAAAPPPPAKIKHLLPKLADLPREAEEKARTEADLRHEIRTLKAQLASKVPGKQVTTAAPTLKIRDKIVEIPMLNKGTVTELHKLVKRVEKARKDLGWACQSLEIGAGGISSQLALATNTIEEFLKRRHGRPEGPRGPEGPVDAPGSRKAPKSEKPRDPDGDVKLLAGERRILEVLAQFNPGSRTRAQLGALTGLTPSGGTFGNYYGRLRRYGYVKEQFDGSIIITDSGLAVFGDDIPDGPGSPDELVAMWREKLLKGERKMLDAVMERYPKPISREQLGDVTGFAHQGGTFGNYLGTLRRNQLVTVDREEIRAADVLFETVEAR